MDDEERDRIEAEALAFFRELYGDQGNRTLAAIGDGSDPDAVLNQRIRELYAGEAQRGADAYLAFWQRVVVLVALGALTGNGVEAGNPVLNEAGDGLSPVLDERLARYLAEMATLFGQTYSQNSLQLTFQAIDRWRELGGDVGQLQDIIGGVWAGPRPVAASITETTRIVNLAQNESWREAGFYGYNVRTREDSLVRPEHQAIADAGPYPMDDRDHEPPFNRLFADPALSINCRCITSPVVEAPSG